MRPTMILLTVSVLSLTACTEPGDFCDVVPGPKLFEPATSVVMVKTDRPDVEQIWVENDYGGKHCGW